MKEYFASAVILAVSPAYSTDYIVEGVTSGVNLYTVGTSSTTIVSGSPFVPTTPLSDGNGGIITAPSYLSLSVNHKLAYAVYDAPSGQQMAASFSVGSSGLTEKWQVILPISSGGDEGTGVTGMQLQGNYLVLPTYRKSGSPTLAGVLMLNSETGAVVLTYSGAITSEEITYFNVLEVEPSGSMYYICNTTVNNDTGVTTPQLQVFTLAKNKLLYTVTDPLQINGECYPSVSSPISN